MMQKFLHLFFLMTALDKKEERQITDLLNEGVKTGVFPGAVLLIAAGGEVLILKEAGILSSATPEIKTKKNSIYDLASLTKPFATTLAVMALVDREIIHLDATLNELLENNIPDDKHDISLRLLLCHSSGLIDWKPYYKDLLKYDRGKRKEVLRQWILNEPLEYKPGTDSKYSDLGFMLLEWIIETASGKKMDEFLVQHFFSPLNLERIFLMKKGARFNPDEIAATEDCPWRKKVLCGEIHDDNAWALGEYSGHAGLFGCAEELYKILNMLREHYYSSRHDFFKPETVQDFFKGQNVTKESTWAIGWDTPSSHGSSAGKYFSKSSVGHLGYTGTSVWMDLEQDVQIIFLSNRVHPRRENVMIKEFRPRLHNLIMERVLEN